MFYKKRIKKLQSQINGLKVINKSILLEKYKNIKFNAIRNGKMHKFICVDIEFDSNLNIILVGASKSLFGWKRFYLDDIQITGKK